VPRDAGLHEQGHLLKIKAIEEGRELYVKSKEQALKSGADCSHVGGSHAP
jgi:hypothetical protein